MAANNGLKLPRQVVAEYGLKVQARLDRMRASAERKRSQWEASIASARSMASVRRSVDIDATASHIGTVMPTKTRTRSKPSTEPRGQVGRPSELTGPLADLAERTGGIGPLAEAVGVSVRMIQRYHAEDVYPPLPVRKVFAVLALQYSTKPPFPS